MHEDPWLAVAVARRRPIVTRWLRSRACYFANSYSSRARATIAITAVSCPVMFLKTGISQLAPSGLGACHCGSGTGMVASSSRLGFRIGHRDAQRWRDDAA